MSVSCLQLDVKIKTAKQLIVLFIEHEFYFHSLSYIQLVERDGIKIRMFPYENQM